jgi:hypothetical protein
MQWYQALGPLSSKTNIAGSNNWSHQQITTDIKHCMEPNSLSTWHYVLSFATVSPSEVMDIVLSPTCQLFPLWYCWGCKREWGKLTVITVIYVVTDIPVCLAHWLGSPVYPFRGWSWRLLNHVVFLSSPICCHVLIQTGLCSILPFVICMWRCNVPSCVIVVVCEGWEKLEMYIGLKEKWNGQVCFLPQQILITHLTSEVYLFSEHVYRTNTVIPS